MKRRSRGRRAAAIFLIASSSVLAACGGPSRRRGAAPEIEGTGADKMSRAYALLKDDRPQEAAAVFSEIVRSDPGNRQARKELAYLQIRFKRWKEAIALIDALLEEDPSDHRMRMELGYAREALGQWSQASDDFSLVAAEPGELQEQARRALQDLEAATAPKSRSDRVDALLDAGYEDLRRGRKPAAREKFTEALNEEPGRTEILKQLGYMSMDDGNKADAAKRFEGERRLDPLDFQTALELGYIYDSLHDEAGAEKSFEAALPSPDPKIHDAAADALRNIRGRSAALYGDVYASPYYSRRFSDKVAYFEASVGYKPDPDGALSVYFGGRYTQDTLSRGGLIPEIYSDNYASLAPGLRLQPHGYSLNLTAEYGLAYNLLKSADHPNAREYDGRVVLADYHYWEGPLKTFADAGGSAGYYSRYRDNVIGYLQLRGGFKAWDDSSSRVSVYAPVNVYKDVNRDFYNNAVEVGGGVELHPWMKVNLKLRAEYLHGIYMGIVGRDPNPYGPRYDDVRVMLIYSGHFAKQPAAPEDFTTVRPRGVVW